MFGHTEHETYLHKIVIYQAVRKMVMRVIMKSGEDNTFVSETGFNFSECYYCSSTTPHIRSFTSNITFPEDHSVIAVRLQSHQ